MSLLATTGVPGEAKNRLDIVDFVEDEKFFTLYVRALQAIQDRRQEAYDSFFQLAGIHGLPFTEWAKAQQQLNPPQAGYCNHGAVLFPTWHRTYVSIYEQILQSAAADIAKRFTVDKEAWEQAAKDLRQPYWDWGFQAVPPSQVVQDEQVSIVDFNGSRVSVKNPILRYTFHPIHPSFRPYAGFNTWGTTVRAPDANRRESKQALIRALTLRATEIRDDTYLMLKDNHTWELFSNHGIGDDAHANSMEAIHDTIHVVVGFGRTRGHMTHPFFAAFDPIFWLHHANVDRLLSLWAAMNPGVWVTAGTNRDQTMGLQPNTEVTKDTPLEPFYQTSSTVWTSAGLTDTTQLGYSYPEFDGLAGGSPELIRDAIDDLVDRRYGTRRSRGASNSALDLLSSFQGVTEEHNEELKMFDWAVHVSFKKFELQESFSIAFYFANAEGDYDSDESYVGSIDAFRGSSPETCANCADNAELVQEGFVHLNRCLAEGVGSFEPDDVLPYLKDKKLCYKIIAEEDDANLTSLEVKLEARPLSLPPGESHPVQAGTTTVYTDVITSA